MVLFRAPDLAAAGNVLGGMAGLHGLGLPGRFAGALGGPEMALLDGAVEVRAFATAARLPAGALLAIALLMPNSLQVLSAYEPALHMPKRPPLLPPASGGRCSGGRPPPGWCCSPPSPPSR